ncbi:MAG: hypothetical protein LAT54_00335 [Cryomorphaceae bacterium]|nr:hypothetical protein [Cryomorphaceae bacterium]
MKKFIPSFLSLSAIALSVLLTAVSCTSDDPEYPFRIRVLTEDLDYEGDDPRFVPVFLAEVRVAPDNPRSNVLFEGLTNTNGEVAFSYDLEALFLVEAIGATYVIDTISFIDSTGYPAVPPRFVQQFDTVSTEKSRACSFIKLEENEEVYLEVILEPWDPSEGLCF